MVTTQLVCSTTCAEADFMGIPDRHVQYSKEPSNVAMYGNTVGGLLAESSELRMQAETARTKRTFDLAIAKARKAAQLDPTNPDSHIVLAKCLTDEIYARDFDVPERIWSECRDEWKTVFWHAPDSSDRTEAAHQMLRLKRDKFAKKFRRNKHESEVQAVRVAGKKESMRDLDAMVRGY